MGVSTLIKNLLKSRGKPPEDLPDDVTTDKYLRSLRRQRRRQLEEMEKEKLLKSITEYEKRRYKYGMMKLGKIKQRPAKKVKQCLFGKYRL